MPRLRLLPAFGPATYAADLALGDSDLGSHRLPSASSGIRACRQVADSIDGLVKMSLPMREAPPIERRDEVKMQKTEETRVQSYDSTMTAFENEALAAAHEVPAEPDEVGEVLAASEPLWAKLKAKLHASPCGEAARKLISNHEAVLRDVTNPAPVSQMDVPRVPVTAPPRRRG